MTNTMVDEMQKVTGVGASIGGINLPMESERVLDFFADVKNVFVLIIAGGIGSRLVGIGSNDVPKQFTVCNEAGETWIQVTVKRFLDLGILAKNVVVITTNNGQTRLAEEQLVGLGVYSSRIHQIANNYDYAGAMIKGAEFIKQIDKDAVIINTPADQYVIADDNFKATMVKAIKAASSGIPTLIGVKTTDLNLIKGCGHAIYDPDDLGETKKVIDFVEKPQLARAEELLDAGNSALNTGINVWSVKTLFEQAKTVIDKKRLEDLEKVTEAIDRSEKIYGKAATKEQIAKLTSDIQSEVKGWSLGTDELMDVFDNLQVSIGVFTWADCGTYDSLYKVLRKSADHKNAKIGGGELDSRYCSSNLFFVAENYLLKAFGLQNSFVAVNSIYNRTVIVVGDMEHCQLVKEFGEKLGDDLITGHSYNIESKNCHVQSTEVEDAMVCFIGLNNHSATSLKGRNGEIIVSISDDSFKKIS
ncbi:hypothetical protein EOM27_03395 [Candidatus Saccharibacteria bacterium]|jgi:mannose-1-phosphate guanylyltransferase|nr:hypothetical protein [Candidatus Saccharibacteria bacterium]